MPLGSLDTQESTGKKIFLKFPLETVQKFEFSYSIFNVWMEHWIAFNNTLFNAR